MKFILNRVLIALVFVALAAPVAFGKERKVTITFATDTMVSGTLVKKGAYDLKFDDQTNQLSVLKNGKEVAKASGRMEKRDRKADRSGIRTELSGSDRRLIGVSFAGSDQEVVL